MCPIIGTFIVLLVSLFVVIILINIAEVVQIKHNEVVHYIIQHTHHMKWHVIICTKLGYRGPALNLTCLR
jgi:hypothetical protein